MNEIICPHCQKAFKIDEAGYADILQQVRNHEFDEELRKREEAFNKEKQSAIDLVREKAKTHYSSEIAAKEKELALLKLEKEKAVSLFNAKIEAFENEKN